MSQFEIGALIGAGLVMMFALGFLFGIGYQHTEDRREFNRFKKDAEKLRKKQFDEAYALGREHERESFKKDVENDWEEMMANPMAQMPWNDIKFGD